MRVSDSSPATAFLMEGGVPSLISSETLLREQENARGKKGRSGRPARYVQPELIQQMRAQGLSFREIARRTGLGYGTVRRAYAGIPSTGQAFRDLSQPGPKK